MAKKSVLFECQHCGFQSVKWLGKCSNCGAWESMVELSATQMAVLKETRSLGGVGGARGAGSLVQKITSVEHESVVKFSSLEEELDIVLGGGIAPGGLYLIGGSPGVGKSTLLLKIAGLVANSGRPVLYVSGEESAGQIKMRAERLGALSENLYLLNEIDLGVIKAALLAGADFGESSGDSSKDSKKAMPYQICVIDSIQTIFSSEVGSAPGSVSQVREVTFALMRLAKEQNIAIFIIGHITKEGSIAGPRILEHMVDCVLYFEGDPSRELRMLRGFKNRFGSTSEIGIFEMKESGLVSAKNASRLFFQSARAQAGAAISVVMEGSRALVIEIQALVSEVAFGNPKRAATGFDVARLNMLLALLERKLELPLGRYDVFINVTGGIKISEPSADLAALAAIISSFRNRPISHKTAFIGEVSLVGDIREVSNVNARLKELTSYGFERVVLAKKPKEKTQIRAFEANEVTKILEWM